MTHTELEEISKKYKHMTKLELIHLIDSLNMRVQSQRGTIKKLENKLALLKESITSISQKDKEWMLEFERTNTNHSYFDFFNKFIHSYGRADTQGVCRIRGDVK